ncbi:MAG TPA: carboxylating nicotinate-nucleotide diphosphorylase [Sedimentisphaerales bacterium]|jgi:nicotinate-nucleotide pyrophosphorylase (carboxylating)|nr:carboxylating nicotinate-nucleotide diphosphorylase [Sedimentisphaerales bacterium]HNU28944.1 carboxylating nicotinate-nucleotide diphosphorylase [Sedimentisphaerales bacterium]
MKKLDIQQVRPLIRMAMEEDLGSGDVTTNLLFKDGMIAESRVVSREEIVVAGLPVLEEILRQYDERLKMIRHCRDGQSVHVGSKLATIRGPLRSMLSVERVMLNFLQRLSGIATTTNRYVRAIKGTKAKIYDTRKTLPGWRLLEKYAVRCGGGYNHRFGLYDGILIKDNHMAELGKSFPARIRRLVQDAKEVDGVKFIAVEVDHVDNQLNHVLKIPGIDIVLLDNMGQWQLKHAVEMRDEMCGKGRGPLLEASGNVNLNNVCEIAQCGVDRIAIGAITHSATAVDIGLDR